MPISGIIPNDTDPGAVLTREAKNDGSCIPGLNLLNLLVMDH
jgi:hypothetical protein